MSRRGTAGREVFITALVVFGAAPAALAHPMSPSVVLLDLDDRGAAAELRLPLRDLALATQGPSTTGSSVSLDQLETEIAAHFRPETPEGRPWTVALVAWSTGQAQVDPTRPAPPEDLLVAHLTLTPPSDGDAKTLRLNDDVIAHEVRSHAALVYARSDWQNGVVAHAPVLLGVLRNAHTSLWIDRSHGGLATGFRAVVHLGLQHIAEGFDHLLFLLMLLLPAPLLVIRKHWAVFGGVSYACSRLVKVVSAFTIGHSLTLAAAAIGLVHLPSGLTESLIGASILVSAAHAFRPLYPGREHWIAGGFGLVHGLAFASVLSGLALQPKALGLTLVGFNLGIELRQLALLACVLPWLLLLARTPSYPGLRIGGAAFGAAAALGWIGQRAFGWPVPVDALFVPLQRHPFVALATLATAAVLASVVQRHTRRASPAPLWSTP